MITNIPDWDFPVNGAQYPEGDGECVADIWPACWCDDCIAEPPSPNEESRK